MFRTAFRPGSLGRGFAALAVPNFRLYWTGQAVSRIGTWMQQISLPWLVLELGGSPLELGVVAALQFVPSLVLGPFGGVFVDRLDKRRVLIATQALSALQVIALFIVTVSGLANIPLVAALSLALGFINALDTSVRQALPADLVPRELLPNAIALNSAAFNGARVVGPALGGVIIAAGAALFGSSIDGIALNFALNAVSFTAVLFALLRMDPSQIRQPPPQEHRPVLSSLAEGVAFAAGSPIILWGLVLLGLVTTFGLNFRILLPLFAQDILQLGAEGYGLLYGLTGLGSLVGALSLAYMRQRPAIALMLGGSFVFGLILVGIAFSRTPLLVAPLAIGAGLTSMLMINTVNATIQANVPDAFRGRVMALYVTMFAGTTPIGGIFAGVVAERWDSAAGFLVGGLVSVAAAILVALAWRRAAAAGRLGITRIGESLETATPR